MDPRKEGEDLVEEVGGSMVGVRASCREGVFLRPHVGKIILYT